MKNTFWTWTIRICALIAGVYTLFQIYDFVYNKTSKIKADYFISEYYLQENLSEQYSFTKMNDYYDRLVDTIFKLQPITDKLEAWSKLHNFLFELLSNPFIIAYKMDMSQTEINIRNNSNKPIKDLNIDLNMNGFCQIYDQFGQISFKEFSQEIILDNLKPRKSTKVIIWSRPPYDPLIRINYDDKSIKPSKKTVTSGILGWFARNRYVINTVLATFFIPFIIVFSIMHLIDKIKNRRELKGKVKQKS